MPTSLNLPGHFKHEQRGGMGLCRPSVAKYMSRNTINLLDSLPPCVNPLSCFHLLACLLGTLGVSPWECLEELKEVLGFLPLNHAPKVARTSVSIIILSFAGKFNDMVPCVPYAMCIHILPFTLSVLPWVA